MTIFRYVPSIDFLSDEELATHGFYQGFQCPHNHYIRDSKEHWCYHCSFKIASNRCGFDINYIHPTYKLKYDKLWRKIKRGEPDDCWPIEFNSNADNPKRMCFPSYRSTYAKQLSDNMTLQKIIYMCAWGDIGSLLVTRICKDPWCGNPLHMVSIFNPKYPPQSIHPLELEYDNAKLMVMAKARAIGRETDLTRSLHKATISYPITMKDAQAYDEIG